MSSFSKKQEISGIGKNMLNKKESSITENERDKSQDDGLYESSKLKE